MIDHPRYDDFLNRIRNLRRERAIESWNGILYRYTSTRYASSKSIMSGAGAFKSGGRWNAPRKFRAVYCASSPELANREYFAGLRSVGLPPHKAMPLTGKAFRATLDAVLDLQNAKKLAYIGTSAAAVRNDGWRFENDIGRESLCQAIGRAAHSAGLDAVLVPSRHALDADDFNIVLFVENAPARSGKWVSMEE